MSCKNKSIRAHSHDWDKTTRPKGFKHLNEQLRVYPGWQFQLSKNEHGRVHGFFISNIFHVIWLEELISYISNYSPGIHISLLKIDDFG